ncbi:hypothetical protein CASFOL_026760 [Castilleja foliolosa]|uniref:histone acetyltransferase n=1 Tax=Castilleja foliolosa TaxID=1961234 RepID=A0ABD3CIT6_9LAMI
MAPVWTNQNAAAMNCQGYTYKDPVNQNFSQQYNSPYIHQGCSINDRGGSSLLAVCNRNSMPPLVDLERMPGGIVYPEQMSSQWCYDMRPSGGVGGPTFSGTFSNPTSGYSNRIRHREVVENNQTFSYGGALSSSSDIMDPSRYVALMPNWISEDANVNLSSGNILAKPMLSHELISQCGFRAFQSQPCPPPLRAGPFKARTNGFAMGQKNIHNKAQYSSVGPRNTPPQGFCNVQASKPVDSIRSPHNILVLYLSDKYNITDACESRQEFLARLHRAACSGLVCKCEHYRRLISHFDYCRDVPCKTCGPIREICIKELYVTTQPAPKRMKMEKNDDWSLSVIVRQSLKKPSEGLINSTVALNNEIPSNQGFNDKMTGNENGITHCEEINIRVDDKQETGRVDTGEVKSCGQSLDFDGISILPEDILMDEAENNKQISEAICDLGESDRQSGKKLEDLKVSSVSLIDFFTPEQIKEHLHSLNQCTNLSAVNGLNGDTGERIVDENKCQLCDVGGRTFTPSPMYCTYCLSRVKHGVNYYRPSDDGTNVKHCFCTKCFKARGGNISFKGLSFSKALLEKCKYTDVFPEGWVQCNKCEAWQHQICALYNSKQDLEGKLDYICPFCRLSEIEAKGHVSIPSAFRARDLPRTKLSDHIEQRLFKSLERERKQRADSLGKSPDEVIGVEDLVVRVVLAVEKELKVKQQFLDILHGEAYPTEFPYKSKVLMLFQKVEGVDVCIFAMYLQEFGSECGHPNNRSIYISYLDSVKHFRPEIKTVDGVALRTFVYHEILIGYLDYCKRRGFTTCYIWACPPIKGDDYILYCHPETQKTPNPRKLLQWYKKLLSKAKEDNVVVEYTNFYDYFFLPSGECNSKITAARLPYFDGDYWSCAIENMIRDIDQEESGSISDKNSKIKTTKRALRATGRTDLSPDNTKDILIMQKLGQKILPLKEEFFVVHLQFNCINCNEPIISGNRWSCNQCKRFHLCSRCVEPDQNSSGQATHTSIRGEKHELYQIRVKDVAADTEDEDVILENDILDNRQSFLKFCQDNHYQFDSLRRAKHSSMMILHQLKNTVCSIFQ